MFIKSKQHTPPTPCTIKKLEISVSFVFILMCTITSSSAQLPEKQVNHQTQFWTSINSTSRISERWAIIGDIHVRRNNGIQDPSFYLVRVAPQFAILPNFTVAAGYAHMWIAPTRSDWQAYVNEHRIYEQAIFNTKLGRTNLLQRIRNEQRWQQIIIDDKPTGDWRFTNRVRYLISVTIPISKNEWVPKPVVAEEILFHFGKPIVYNTFDQNRIFLGIRQKLGKNMNFDFGYMNVYQQKFTGYQYDMNHTIRLFFYYTPDFRIGQKSKTPTIIEENPG